MPQSRQVSLLLLFTAGILFSGCSSNITNGVFRSEQVVTPELIRGHMMFLASDSLKGRNTPSPELDSAASYIASVFRKAGLKPVRGSYFEPFILNKISLGDTNTLEVVASGKSQSFVLKDDFTPFDMTGDRLSVGDVVFAGYGITAPELQYDDYAGIDVKGKVVFVLRHEPGEEDSSSTFKGKFATEYSNVGKKVRIAIDHGAIGMLVATDPLNHSMLTPRGFPWPSLSKHMPKDALPFTLAAEEGEKIPVVHVGPNVIAALFGSVDSLRALQSAIDRNVRPISFALKGITVRLETSTQVVHAETRNVVGWIEGRDPAVRDELVVIGAHYDHVGTKKDHAPGEDYIFNGADDNASGTTAVLGVAAAFGTAREHPRRSILLMTFAGEEKGLFGSEYYTRKPLFPLNKTIAMINMDMVGRNSEDSLSLIGAGPESLLNTITREENEEIGFALVNELLTSGGSDHQSFAKRDVPVIFYHSGLHPDYHQVSDHAELINMKKVAKVARLAFRTAWRLADAP
jgi:hypothetical protein